MAVAAARRPQTLGHEEPRIFTPPLRPLTPETTLGYAVIDFAEQVVGIQLLPYQRWLYVHALELLEDGSLRFRVIVVLVARQNGKSTWSQILALFWMYVLGRDLVIGTAQDLDVAEEIWQGAVEIVESNPDLNDQLDRVVRTNGKKSLELKTGERWKVKAANRKAGRGLSGDLVLLDELREHQTWAAWAAVTKTTMARAHALIVALSNAGDGASVVLRYLRRMAHAPLGDPDKINDISEAIGVGDLEDGTEAETEELIADDSLGIFEWSAPPNCPRSDPQHWAEANPAVGYTITERTIASAAATDPDVVFRTEVLCQWTDGALDGPFPIGSWEAGWVGEDSKITSKVCACVDLAADSSRASIAFAGHLPDGTPQVEIVASRAGVGWIQPWLEQRRSIIDGICGQQRGAPVSALLEVWEAEGLPISYWTGADLPTAARDMFTAVRDKRLAHLPQPLLDVAAAAAATKPAGDGLWFWDRKRSPVDIAPLVAATGALWLLQRRAEPVPVSIYETRGLVML